MRALAVLLAKAGYAKIALLWGRADLSKYDDIWCSCYGYAVQCPELESLSNEQKLIYVANDPAFFGLPIGIASRIDCIAFAGSDAGFYANMLWPGKLVYKIRLWQEMFHSRGRASLENDYHFLLGYAGNERTKWRSERLSNLLVPNVPSKIVGCMGEAKLDYDESQMWMRQCYAQLVVGDPGYCGLFPAAHRLLQGLSLSPFVFVDACLLSSFGNDLLDNFFIAEDAQRIERTLWALQTDSAFEAEAYNSLTNFWKAL